MLSKSIQKIMASIMALAIISVYSNVALAQATMGEITVNGNVSVNGQPAVSASTITTDSTITTGANSGAVINFGANGKVELFADTTIQLKFTETSIVAVLTAGKIRVMNAAGVGATVTTRTATVVADTGRANSFLVSLGCSDDSDCQETFVETFSGLVTMTSNNDQTLKQIPAGARAASGEACSEACTKPGGFLPIALTPGINNGLLAAILGGVGAAAIVGILIPDNPVELGGDVPVISPTS